MIVKTDKVRERGASIGVFSRQGFATTMLNSHFRDKGYLYGNTNLDSSDHHYETPHRKRKTRKTAPSSCFRVIPRDKNPRLHIPCAPDVGLYKPSFSQVLSKPISLPINPLPNPVRRKASQSPTPDDVSTSCGYKIREIKRLIKKQLEEISAYRFSLQELIKAKLIESEVYERLSDPEMVSLCTDDGHSRHRQRKIEPSNLQEQAEHAERVYHMAQEIDRMRETLKKLVDENMQALKEKEGVSPEKPKVHLNGPVRFDQQVDRPEIVRKDHVNAFEDLDVSRSSLHENSHRVRKFIDYTSRKPYLFEPRENILQHYDVPIKTFDLIKPLQNRAQIILEKQKKREEFNKKEFLNSMCDYINLNKSSEVVSSRKDLSLVDMNKTTSRENHVSRIFERNKSLKARENRRITAAGSNRNQKSLGQINASFELPTTSRAYLLARWTPTIMEVGAASQL